MANFPTSVSTDANLYIAVNGLQTTLAVAVGTGDTTLTLTSTSNFPSTGMVTVDNNEVVSYTGISGADLTGCTRGADGTTAFSHAIGVTVGLTVVAAHHNRLKDEVIAVETALGASFAKNNLTSTPGTDGITVTGGTNAVIGSGTSISQQAATNAVPGYLTATDHSTFATAATTAAAALPAASFTDAAVTGKLITGYVSGAGVVGVGDTILQAIDKLDGNDAAKLPLAGGTMTGDITMSNDKAIVLKETTANGTDAITLKAPASVTSSYTIQLPPAVASPNQVLTDVAGNGVLSWSATGSGTVNSGTAGRVAVYPASASAVDDTYTQNTKDIDILVEAQGSRSANLELTIPNPGNTIAAATFSVSEGATQPIVVVNSAKRNSVKVFDNFDRSDRALIGDIAPSGQAWALTGTGYLTASITNGAFISTDNVYASLDFGSRAYKLAGAFSFVPGGGTNDRTLNSLSLIFDSGNIVLNDIAHLIISPNGWNLQKRVGGGGFTGIASGKYNLDVDGTIYGIAIEISGNNVTVVSPDGRRTTVVDTDLGGMTLRYGILQINNSTNSYTGRWNGILLGEPLCETERALGYSAGYSMARKGTNTDDNAVTGDIGEYVESIISTNTNDPATGVYGDLTSISLTAGDWDVYGKVGHNSNSGTWSAVRSGISLTSGNSSTGLTAGSNVCADLFASTSTAVTLIMQENVMRYSFNATTTVYLKYRADYTAGTPTAQGSLKARRVR